MDKDEAPSAYAWYIVVVLTLVQILAFIDRYLPSLLIEPMKQDLGLSDFEIGLLLGPAFVVFYITLGVPIGRLADRFNRRAILAVGIATWCAMTAAAGLARSFVPLFAARLGVGLGEATVGPTSISLISDYFAKPRRAPAISLFMTGTFLGAGSTFLFLGPVVHALEHAPGIVLPFLGEIRSWRLCFLVVGLPGLLLSAAMFTIREPARREVTDDAPSFRQTLAYIGTRWRAFGTLYAASACNVVLGSLGLWNVALFKRNFGWNVAEVGIAVGTILLTAGPLGTLLGIHLTRRWGARNDATLRALTTGLLIAVPAYALFPLMADARLALAFLACSHIGTAMATAAGPATLTLLAPGQIRAQSMAIYYFVIAIFSQLLGPPLVGLMTDLFGDPSSLRFAISIEVVLIGIPALTLVFFGFPHFRRGASEFERALAPTP